MTIQRAKNHKGQGIVEYVLITALMAIAMIAVFKSFRADITTAYKKAGQAIVQGVDDSGTGGAPGQ